MSNYLIASVIALVLVFAGVLILTVRRTNSRPLPVDDSAIQTTPPPATVPAGTPIEIETVRIEPGTFKMGDPANRDAGQLTDDRVHTVTLTKSYLMGKYHVTQRQFAQFVGETGYRTTAEKCGYSFVHTDKSERFQRRSGLNWRTAFAGLPDSIPVVCVSWYDAGAFCQWVERKTNKKTRLPTEAEWEYACRAGTTSSFNVAGPPDSFGWFGNNSGDHPFDARALGLRTMAEYKQKVIAEHCVPHSVGLKKPNQWGLFDMHGNAWEWCQDAVAPYSSQAVVDPTGPDDPSPQYRIARGGNWFDVPSTATSANRGNWIPGESYYHLGFRIVQEP